MEKNQSPLPSDVQLTFPSIVSKIIDGKKIHKLEWKDKEFYGLLKDGTLKLHKPDGKFYDWILNDGDLTGTDWIIL